MHLAIVSPFPPSITGIGQYGYHVTRALAGSGAFTRVTVLAGSRLNGAKPNHLGLTELEYCWAPGQLKARAAILSRVRRLSPDVVWFNLGASVFGKSPWTNVSGWLAPMLTRGLGTPTVVTLHELVELADLRALKAPGGPFAAWGARLLTGIATQADVTCLTMRHYADWLAAREIECSYIPIGAYHTPELLEESDSQELLFFTTLAPFKGLELLLEAFHVVHAEYPRLRLTIAGADHTRFPDYARELKARSNGGGHTQWLGQIPEEQVSELFQRALLIVLPYTASTGSSSVLYQAATWGRAVVASDLAETRRLADENDLRVEFFRSGDVESLCTSIRALLKSPERRRSQIRHNFKSIQRTRPEATSLMYIHAFNRALEKRKSPKRFPIPRLELESS